MTETVVLILRIVMAVALYAFLGGALYIIWRDLRTQSVLITNRQAPTLKITRRAAEQVTTREFTSAEIIIGRDATCDYTLINETVSSRHARLSHHHAQWWVEDLRSTNGSFINDERIETPVVIISGDELRCGQEVLEIEIDGV